MSQVETVGGASDESVYGRQFYLELVLPDDEFGSSQVDLFRKGFDKLRHQREKEGQLFPFTHSVEQTESEIVLRIDGDLSPRIESIIAIGEQALDDTNVVQLPVERQDDLGEVSLSLVAGGGF